MQNLLYKKDFFLNSQYAQNNFFQKQTVLIVEFMKYPCKSQKFTEVVNNKYEITVKQTAQRELLYLNFVDYL